MAREAHAFAVALPQILRGVALIVGLVATVASAAQPRITLLSPSGGEYFIDGQQQTVRVSMRLRKVNVELTRDGGDTFEKVGTIDATSLVLSQRTSVQWTVSLPASNSCFIRVTDGIFTATSGMFAILPAVGGVTTESLAGASVTTAKLADGSVTNPKLADHAVNTQKIDSSPAAANSVLAADGNGGATWQPVSSVVTGAPPVGTAGGDLTGNYPTPQVAASAGNSLIAAINNPATTATLNSARLPVAGTAPANVGGVYADTTSIAVAPDGKLSAVPSGITLNGDVTGPADSNAIAPGAVTGAKIANSTITGGNLAANIGISTTGNIATTGSGTVTSAGLLTASNGLTVTGTVTLPSHAVADTALSTNVVLKNAANTFTVGPQTMTTGNDAAIGLVVKGNSGTQSADLQQWQNSSATPLMRLSSGGNLGLGSTAPNEQIEVANTAGGRMILSDGGGASRLALLLQGPGTAHTTYGRVQAYNYGTSTGLLLALNDQGGNVSINGTASFGALTVNGSAAGANLSALTLYNNAGFSGGAAVSLDYYPSNTSTAIPSARISAIDDGSFSAHVSFLTKNQGAATNPVAERMRLTSTGKLYLVNGGTISSTPTFYIGQSIDSMHGFTTAINGVSAGTALHLQSDPAGSIAYTANGGTSYPFFVNNTGQEYLSGYLGVATTSVSANARLAIKDGHLQSQQTTAPTVAVNANAGTAATASLNHATDIAGNISLTTGTAAWAAGTQLTITFNKTFNVAPTVTLTPTNANAADGSKKIYISATTTGFSVNFGAAEIVSTAYTWSYQVIETQ